MSEPRQQMYAKYNGGSELLVLKHCMASHNCICCIGSVVGVCRIGALSCSKWWANKPAMKAFSETPALG